MIDFGDRGEEEKPPPRPVEATGGEASEEPFFDPFSSWYDPAHLPQFEVVEEEEAELVAAERVERPRLRLPAGLVILTGLALLAIGFAVWVSVPPFRVIWFGATAAVAVGGTWIVAGIATILTERKTVDIPLWLVPRFRWVTAREIVETLLLAVLIFLAVRASLQNFRVEGTSMLPSLENEQYLIVNKLAYAEIDLKIFDWVPFFDPGEDSVHHLFGAPSRGDVIVFRAPNTPDRDFIKRIIGKPGDTVRIDATEGTVLVNDKPLEEPYVKGETVCGASCGPWTVPPNHYFVLGDNRQNSSDSRSFGFVPEENIIGKAFLSYWPLDDAGLAPNHSVSFATEASAED